MRLNIHQTSACKMEEKYYIIEYKCNDKWYQLIDRFFLKEYEFGQNTACGDCWQKTGQYGMYNLEYAKEYCNKLNEAVANGAIDPKLGITEFRIAEIEWTFKRQVLAPVKY